MGCPAEWVTLLKRRAEYRPGVHVTDCLGCPRRKALCRDGATPALSRLEARLNGSILHSRLASVDPDTAEVGVYGTMFGVHLVGSADRIREPEPGELSQQVAPGLRVWDYKGEKADGKPRRPDRPYPEQVWQFEMYRHLASTMMSPIETVGWTVWFRYGAEWIDYSHDGPIWTEVELGRFKPHGSDWTVAELAVHVAKVEKGELVDSFGRVGETMKMGKESMCKFCEYEEDCHGKEVVTAF